VAELAARQGPDSFFYFGDYAQLLAGAKREKPGRKGHGLDYYVGWAGRYADLVQGGDRHPIKTLAVERGLPSDYVRDTINTARRTHHLLTDPGRGRAGGQLTAKALQLIAERDGQEGCSTVTPESLARSGGWA
jgi:hypothetical protein